MSYYGEEEERNLWWDMSHFNEGNASWELKDSKRIRKELGEGADPNEGFALHKAVELRSTQTVYALVKHGADVNLSDHFGNTPIHMVVDSLNNWFTEERETQAVTIAKYLIKNGADVTSRGYMGNSVLHRCNSPKLIDLFIKNGADPAALNDSCRTPYEHQKDRIDRFNCGSPSLIAELSPVLKAANDKHHIENALASLSTSWKPSNSKDENVQSSEPKRQARRRAL